MPEASSPTSATPSNRVQLGLQLVATKLAGTHLDELAAAIGKDDTQASRIRSGHTGASVTDVVRLLYAAGLKVVSADRVCVDGATYQAMTTIASRAMADQRIAQQLIWDDQQ